MSDTLSAVRSQLGQTLGKEPESLPDDLSLDSVLGVWGWADLEAELEQKFDVDLEYQLDGKTLREAAEHIEKLMDLKQ